MTAPILDPEHNMWLCPCGHYLFINHHIGAPLTFDCESCGRVWDAVPQERVTA